MLYKIQHAIILLSILSILGAEDLILENETVTMFGEHTYSTIHLTKEEMYNISKILKFDNILKETWSCWYPKNGKPCGRCVMCRERPDL